MASLTYYKNKDGSQMIKVTVVRKRIGFKKSKSFPLDQLDAAKKWGYDTENEIDWGQRKSQISPDSKLGDVIDEYIKKDGIGDASGISRSLKYAIKKLKQYHIADMLPSEIDHQAVMEFAETRSRECEPQTVKHSLDALKHVMESCSIYGIEVQRDVVKNTYPTLKIENKIGRSNVRHEAASDEDIAKIRKMLAEIEAKPSCTIPYVDLFDFEMQTALRISEICRIEWADFSEQYKTLLVKRRKTTDPLKEPEDHLFPLSRKACEIIKKQPRKKKRIFPYNDRSISSFLARKRKQAGISATFHDLRATVATNLLIDGFDIKTVSVVTGHKDLNVLWKIYARLKNEGKLREYLTSMPDIPDLSKRPTAD